MENNLNNKNSYYSNMGKSITMILVLMFSIISISAVTENQLVGYEFEEGTGSVIFDTSGNGNNAIRNGGTWNNNIVKWGTYSFKYDGGNDYIYTLGTQTIPDQFSVSIWVNRQNKAGETNIFSIYDVNYSHFDFTYNENTGETILYHLNQTTPTITFDSHVIDTAPLISGTWYHLVLTIDTISKNISYYKDGILINTAIDQDEMIIDQFNNLLRIGTDKDLLRDYKGYTDSFRFFDFVLSQSQIIELNTLNGINLNVDPVVINNITESTIITNYFPIANQTITNSDTISILLNYKSSCDLYLDNDLVESYLDILGFNYDLTLLENGDHSYFIYCEYIDTENNKLFEVSDVIPFSIQKPIKTIEFFIYDINKNLANNEDLFLTTPCVDEKEFGEYWINDGDKEYYIQHLVNGISDFNLSYDGDYEFCLLKGKVNYKDDTYSLDYDFVDVEKQTELGNLFVGAETLTYSLIVENDDLYKVTAPEFWGKTWEALFELVIGILIGGMIMIIGMMMNNDKLMMVGGLIIAIGMGVSVTTILGGVIV